jgi:hypothetical protein
LQSLKDLNFETKSQLAAWDVFSEIS